MSLRFRTFFVSLSLLFTLAACESKEDIARKPDVARDMIENSIAKCDTGQVAAEDGAPYAQRMNKVLMNCRTKDLETLRDHGYTIALDQRLPRQENGTWDKYIDGVFYNQGGDNYVSIWDNGKGESSFWSLDTYDRGPENLAKLAQHLRDGDIGPGDHMGYSAQYSRHSGKTTTYYQQWNSPDNFDKDSQQKNPELLNLPTKDHRASQASNSW